MVAEEVKDEGRELLGGHLDGLRVDSSLIKKGKISVGAEAIPFKVDKLPEVSLRWALSRSGSPEIVCHYQEDSEGRLRYQGRSVV